mmetsp:Transcript_21398/g.44549  ORF Transcript_21398/g.44549 Transcript_21398/m.44549 type:complete len:320 (-) Transcript_21398:5-964(-)
MSESTYAPLSLLISCHTSNDVHNDVHNHTNAKTYLKTIWYKRLLTPSNDNNNNNYKIIFVNATTNQITSLLSSLSIPPSSYFIPLSPSPLPSSTLTNLYTQCITQTPSPSANKPGVLVVDFTDVKHGKKTLSLLIKKGKNTKKKKMPTVAIDEDEDGQQQGGSNDDVDSQASNFTNVVKAWSIPSTSLRLLKSRSDNIVGDYTVRESSRLSTFVDGGHLTTDDEGWTTVTYKQSGIDGGKREVEGMVEGSITAEQQVEWNRRDRGRKRKRKVMAPKEGLKDFYRFQKKEIGREERRRLKEGMERDKEIVKRMVKGKIGK